MLDGIAIGCMASLLMIQWMPSCVEGLYWYNGAVNYGLFYAIMLFLICSVISLHMASEKKDIANILVCCLWGFLLEGGNHVTAFMGLLFVFGFGLLELYQGKKKKAVYMSVILVFMLVCFVINVSSPGTKIRQSNFVRTDAFTTIKAALVNGMQKIDSWFGLASVVAVLMVIPIYFRLIKKVYINTSFRFSNPFIVFMGSVAWICAMYCPPIYAMGFLGAGRLQNIVYYNFVILLFVNAFYCSGWVMCRFGTIDADSDFQIDIKWLCCASALIVGLLISTRATTWSHKAIEEIESGEAYQYSQEAFARDKLLLESEGKDVVVNEYSVKPEILFFDDISDDPDDWRNGDVKRFYNLNSIVSRRLD